MSNGRPRGPMGGHGRGMSGEKAKNFKGAMKRLFIYMERYRIQLFIMLLFAVGSTIFNIIGPKILGRATTELFNGLVSKISGGAGIDFGKIAQILIGAMCLYAVSALFSFIQGFIMSGKRIDYERTARTVLDEFRSGKIGKITLEVAP